MSEFDYIKFIPWCNIHFISYIRKIKLYFKNFFRNLSMNIVSGWSVVIAKHSMILKLFFEKQRLSHINLNR